ncbi:uncharacterized protein LOC127835470 [Dreissena polymorpha]|uniref:uncharacterized protein LOC127835470 n=1 Tax=Dreissena polymorpha TaxID=45954 RepID=UPI0022652CB5|nr:uncharacterized protein LOC127835470 [Dreissena polymorpha]
MTDKSFVLDWMALPTENFVYEVTKHHYVDRHERTCCQNHTCGIVFGLTPLRRPHHCHRCGEVFCQNCLCYSRKLDASAQPDVNGTSCKVCYTCFSERPDNQCSVTRSHTEFFSSMLCKSRKERRNTECDIVLEHNHGEKRFWQDQSLERNVNYTHIETYEHFLYTELLVYYEDSRSFDKARVAIIRVLGAPEKEPKHSVFLRICAQCKGELTRRQLRNQERFTWKKELQRKESAAFESVLHFDDHFRDLTARINVAFDGVTNDDQVRENSEAFLSLYKEMRKLFEAQ